MTFLNDNASVNDNRTRLKVAAMQSHYSKATTVAEWEAEYDEYCASLDAEELEAVNDNGFYMVITPHEKGQVAAERQLTTVMTVLQELRHRSVDQLKVSFAADGSPKLHLYFHDHVNDEPGKAEILFQVDEGK